MNISNFIFNDKTKTIRIVDISRDETIDAFRFLIDNNYIGQNDFSNAYFSYSNRWGAKVELRADYTDKPYSNVVFTSINLKRTSPEDHEFEDVEVAVSLLKMLDLYMFDSIEDILKENKDKYIFNGKYEILVSRSGLFRFSTAYGGAFFLYD